MKNADFDKAMNELNGLSLREEDKELITSKMQSIFFGKDDLSSSLELFLNSRIRQIES